MVDRQFQIYPLACLHMYNQYIGTKKERHNEITERRQNINQRPICRNRLLFILVAVSASNLLLCTSHVICTKQFEASLSIFLVLVGLRFCFFLKYSVRYINTISRNFVLSLLVYLNTSM